MTVTPKTVCAPFRAEEREDGESTSALMTSTPFLCKAWADGADGARVMARREYCFESSASLRTELMIEPPCWPVAPKTTRSLLMVVMLVLLWLTWYSEMAFEVRWRGMCSD